MNGHGALYARIHRARRTPRDRIGLPCARFDWRRARRLCWRPTACAGPGRARPGGHAGRRCSITGGTVVTMDAGSDVIPDGAVAVDRGQHRRGRSGGGDRREVRRRPNASTRAGRSSCPGSINTHTHAPMVLYPRPGRRPGADGLAAATTSFPAEAKTVSPDFVRVGTRLAALEMIESGTTTFADMYYFEDDIADVVHEAGLRAVLGQSVIQFPVADAKTPAEGAGASRGVHQEVEGRSAHHARRGAARAVHASTPETLQGGRGAGQPATACRC